MEGLLRLPWSIEARLSDYSPSATNSINPTTFQRNTSRVPAGGTVPPRKASDSGSYEGRDKRSASILKDFVKADEFAHIDCYLDAVDRHPLGDNFPVGSRVVRIRGLKIDNYLSYWISTSL